MTFYQFNALDEVQQADAIWEHGVFLDSRIAGPYRYILYQLGGFYVELHYQAERNVLEGARVFANPDHLEPYLAEMDICI
jgi:hypothetical protein